MYYSIKIGCYCLLNENITVRVEINEKNTAKNVGGRDARETLREQVDGTFRKHHQALSENNGNAVQVKLRTSQCR